MFRNARVVMSSFGMSALCLTSFIVVAPTAEAVTTEETVMATWSPAEGLKVDISGVSFADSCYNATNLHHCNVYVQSFYVDPSGPWDISQSSIQVWPDNGPAGFAIPSSFTLSDYLPWTNPLHTHVQVTVSTVDGSTYGTSVAVSARVQVKDVLPKEPLLTWVQKWKPSTSNGYTEYAIYVSPGQRRFLPGEICDQMNCTYSLWAVSGSGEEFQIKNGGQLVGYINSDVLTGTIGNFTTNQRVFVRLTAADGRTEDSPHLAPPPSTNHVVSRGVDQTALTATLATAGLDAIAVCPAMQGFRRPQDSYTTEASIVCFEAYEAGGWTAVVQAIVNTFGAAGAGYLMYAATEAINNTSGDPGGSPAPITRPVPPPNASDPPGSTVSYVGDPYWGVMDRIETRMRVDVDPAYSPQNDDDWSTAARLCYAQGASQWNGVTAHPCETEKIFLPGLNVFQAAQHDAEAIVSNPAWVKLTRGQVPGVNAGWYSRDSRCFGTLPTATACDEYPYFSTVQGGPGASLKTIDAAQNSLEGTRLNQFYAVSRCNVPQGASFLVIPTVLPVADESTAVGPPTFWVCS